jgi:uncharacterized protein
MHEETDPNASVRAPVDWIYDEAVTALRRHCGRELEDVRIDRLVVGVFATGIGLSNGLGGVAYTPPELVAQASRRILHGTAPVVRGQSALEVVMGLPVGPFTPVIRLATLNALSVPVLEAQAREEDDELSVLRPLVAGRRVCMVGAMVPLINRLRALGWAELLVADRKADTLAEAKGCTVVDLDRLDETLASCQTAIFTGASIANGSLPQLLTAVSPETAVAVVGPTAGFVPDPLFDRGVALIATTIVTDADAALDVLAEGGGLYPLFGHCLRKINLVNPGRLAGLGWTAARDQ